MATDLEVAWAAGLFEGEGTITVSHQKGRAGFAQPRLKLSMTDEDVVRRFAAIVGCGSVREARFDLIQEHWKKQWCWYVGNRHEVFATLSLLLDWLGTRRRDRAEEVMELCIPPEGWDGPRDGYWKPPAYKD